MAGRSLGFASHVVLAVGIVGVSFEATALADTPDDALEEVVVTAQRRSEDIQKVPLSITAVTGAELDAAGILDIRDLGDLVSGLSFMSQGPFAEPVIRGVQSTIALSGADSPIAIYVDGIYQPNQLANIFDLSDITQVEVLKGPQGTLFGRNATGGAISIHTMQPSYQTTGSITTQFGYYDGSDQNSPDYLVKGYISGPLIDNVLAYSVSAIYRDVEGYLRDDVNGEQSGESKTYTVRGKLLFQPFDGVSFLATAFLSHRFDLEAGSTTALNGNSSAAYYPGGIASNSPWHVASDLYRGADPIYDVQWGGSFKADFKLNGLGTLSSLSAYTNTMARYDVDLATGTSAGCFASFVCLNFDENYPDEAFQEEINFVSEKFGPFSFVGGLFYYHDNAIFGADIDPPLYPDGFVNLSLPSQIGVEQSATVNTRARAVFGEGTYDISSDWHLIAGLRYSEEAKWGVGSIVPRFPTTGDVKDHATTPRVSVRYDFTPDTNVYFTYSKGFTSAVISSFDQTNDYSKPETLDAYEVGVKSSGEHYRLTAAAYAYNIKDLQAQFWTGTDTVLANAQGAKMRGLEADAQAKITRAFKVDVGVSWLGTARYEAFSGIAYQLPQSAAGMTQDIVNGTGERMIKTPKTTGNLTASYDLDLPVGLVTFSGTESYSSSYFFDLLQRVTQGGYGTLNGNVFMAPTAVKGLRVGLFGRNLTNKAYFQSSLLGPSSDAPVFSAPREIGVSAGYAF
jgi:iron complex outermembrane receptor protein